MKTIPAPPSTGFKKRYLVAVVLGTALTAVSAPRTASAQTLGGSPQVISDMTRYCTACWRNARLPADYWGDCTQDVFRRLLQRLAPAAWKRALEEEGEEHREFIRAIDAVKKQTQRSLKRSPAVAGVIADPRLGPERALHEAREEVDHAANELLSARQQRILQLSFEGWSVNDIAGKLDLTPARVSDEKYKAIRKLREHFAAVA